DISSVTASYDTSGSFSFTATYYNALNNLDTSENFGIFAKFSIVGGEPPEYGEDFSICSYDTAQGGVFGQHHVFSNGVNYFNQAEVSGYDGKLQLTRTESADHKSITVSGSSPALANHDWRCFNYELLAEAHASASNPNSHYSAACDCWYVSRKLD